VAVVGVSVVTFLLGRHEAQEGGPRGLLARYAAVIKDPDTPVMGLEVIVNDGRAVPFFEALLRQFGIPGEVVVRP
jgi:hypothetical protein